MGIAKHLGSCLLEKQWDIRENLYKVLECVTQRNEPHPKYDTPSDHDLRLAPHASHAHPYRCSRFPPPTVQESFWRCPVPRLVFSASFSPPVPVAHLSSRASYSFPEMLPRGRKDIAVLKREVDFRDSVTQTGSDDLFTCKVVRKLGKGTDGVVFLVTCPDSSLKESALKLIPKKRLPKDKEDEVDPFAMNREVQLLQRLNHPHIIEYKASFQTTLSFGLLNEYCEYGTLETWRKNTQFLRSEPEVRILFLQLLSAVHHLHSQKVYHLDIFIQNILLTSNSAKTGLILKLADFGWAFDYGFDWTRERKEDFYQEMDLKQLSWLLPELCPNDSSDSRSLPLASLFQSVNVRFDLDLPLLQISDYVNHDWVLESTPFPSVIPLSALQEKPNFSNIDDEQSTLNRTTMLHAAGLLHLVGLPRW